MQVQTLTRRPQAPTEKRQATEAAVLQAMEDLLGEGVTYASARHRANRQARRHLAHRVLLLLRRQARAAHAPGVQLSDELYREADAWWSGAGDGSEQLVTALGNVAALYREHGPLVCAIVEVSAYDEVVGPFWRAIVGRFVEASAQRIATEVEAGRADPSSPEATASRSSGCPSACSTRCSCRRTRPATTSSCSALGRIWTTTVYGPPPSAPCRAATTQPLELLGLAPHRVELARLQPRLDVVVDLLLAGVGLTRRRRIASRRLNFRISST